MISAWTAAAVAAIASRPLPAAPLITRSRLPSIAPGYDLWDFWPVETREGRIAPVLGGSLWMALSAPVLGDPVLRHAVARIRLLHRVGEQWRDLGNVLPDGHSPGSREWSGCAVLDRDELALHFTAAGRRGEPQATFEQRMFVCRALLDMADGTPRLLNWSAPIETIINDGRDYAFANEAQGSIGSIKAFRDPGYFRDPADRQDYLLFAGSVARSTSDYCGAVGVARRDGERWILLPPLVTADGLNNELERPHLRVVDGRYLLFWSTQASVFDPRGAVGPTGLYAMSAHALAGPYSPVATTGLVLANPPEAPDQAYSWVVLQTLDAVSFADSLGPGGRPTEAVEARERFGGTIAPAVNIRDQLLANMEQGSPRAG